MKNMEAEEEAEALVFAFRSNNNYYVVQSPSSVSHGHIGHGHETLLMLPLTYHSPDPDLMNQHEEEEEEEEGYHHRINQIMLVEDNQDHASRTAFSLSRCSSSRAASITSFVEEIKENNNNIVPAADHSMILINDHNINHVAIKKQFGDHHDDDDDGGKEDYYDQNHRGSCCKYFSFNTYPSSFVWIVLQLLWRFLLSFIAALIVFYIATKPPSPHISVKIAGVNQFELGEGVDSSGVSTNFLSCNISMGLVIDNKSKVYGLHIMSPLVEIYYGRVPLVASQGAKEVYEESHEESRFKVYAGVTTKPMYAAGRNMQDLLDSGKGLPLHLSLSFSSYYRVVATLVHPTFHHRAHCLLSIHNFYDNKHRTQAYNSTCVITVKS